MVEVSCCCCCVCCVLCVCVLVISYFAADEKAMPVHGILMCSYNAYSYCVFSNNLLLYSYKMPIILRFVS